MRVSSSKIAAIFTGSASAGAIVINPEKSRFAQSAAREQMVGVDRSAVIDKDYRCRWLDISVLECIIEHKEVYIGVDRQHRFDTLATVLAHGKSYAFEFLVDLVGFVAYVVGSAFVVGENKPFGLALVTTA